MAITGSRAVCHHAEPPKREYKIVIEGGATSTVSILTERMMEMLAGQSASIIKVTTYPDGYVTETKLI